MHKKLLIVLLPFLSLMIIPFVAKAAIITSSTLDKETFFQGQTGYITVKIFNDKGDVIRVTDLAATINYFYTDGNVYLQKFFTNATLPIQIQQGQLGTFHILFSLPTNIASGYTNIDVKAETELWDGEANRWRGSDHPTYQQKLFIETPYRQQLAGQQATNQQLQKQLQEQQTINEYNITMMYIFGATAILFAVLIGFLILLHRRARIIAQPTA